MVMHIDIIMTVEKLVNGRILTLITLYKGADLVGKKTERLNHSDK